MEKTVLGSNSVRGKKKRRNIRKLTPRYPQMHAQMTLRRILSGATAASSEVFFAGAWGAAPAAMGAVVLSAGFVSVWSAIRGRATSERKSRNQILRQAQQTFICCGQNAVKAIPCFRKCPRTRVFQRRGSATVDSLPVARNTMSASAAINFGES